MSNKKTFGNFVALYKKQAVNNYQCDELLTAFIYNYTSEPSCIMTIDYSQELFHIYS